jgi:spore maturation protein SpmB
MQVGNLVRTVRPRIGIPADSLGLVIAKLMSADGFAIWLIKLLHRGAPQRFLARDLEVVSQ